MSHRHRDAGSLLQRQRKMSQAHWVSCLSHRHQDAPVQQVVQLCKKFQWFRLAFIKQNLSVYDQCSKYYASIFITDTSVGIINYLNYESQTRSNKNIPADWSKRTIDAQKIAYEIIEKEQCMKRINKNLQSLYRVMTIIVIRKNLSILFEAVTHEQL